MKRFLCLMFIGFLLISLPAISQVEKQQIKGAAAVKTDIYAKFRGWWKLEYVLYDAYGQAVPFVEFVHVRGIHKEVRKGLVQTWWEGETGMNEQLVGQICGTTIFMGWQGANYLWSGYYWQPGKRQGWHMSIKAGNNYFHECSWEPMKVTKILAPAPELLR